MACGKEERREEAKNTEARLRGLASTLSWAWPPFLGEQILLPASRGQAAAGSNPPRTLSLWRRSVMADISGRFQGVSDLPRSRRRQVKD